MDVNTFLFGQEEKLKKKPTMSPEQQQFFSQFINQLMQMSGGGGGGGFGQAMQGLQDYMNPESEAYKNFEAPYLTEFNEQTLPGIGEQYAGKGALSSSGFGQALGGAASQYKSQMTGMKEGLRNKSIMDFLNYYLQQSGMALGKEPFAYHQKGASAGFVPQAASAAIKAYGGGGG